MAAVLKIKDVSGADVIDLLAGTLKLNTGQWGTKTGVQRGEYKASRYGAQFTFNGIDLVDEAFELNGEGTAANLRAALNGLEAMAKKVRDWHDDPLNQTSYWLHWASDGETEKRALLYNLALEYPQSIPGVNPLLKFGAVTVKLGLTHHGLLEDLTQDTSHAAVAVSCAGGKFVDATGAGTESGRIWVAAFSGVNGGGGPLSRFWAGIREPYLGTSSFNPVWEAESGSNESADVSTVADGAASGGNKKRITFATSAALVKRSRIVLSTIESTNPHHFVGKYLVLARMALTAAGTVGVKIQSGFNQTASFTPNEEVYFSDTAWRLIELGEIQIPPSKYPSGGFYGTDALKNFSIDIYAERISGSASLDIDCLYLIPSRHFAFADGAVVQYVVGDERPLYLVTMEDDSVLALAYQAGIPSVNMAPTMRDFYWPVGGGAVVLCGERAASHVLTDTVNVALQVFPRWKGFRAS